MVDQTQNEGPPESGRGAVPPAPTKYDDIRLAIYLCMISTSFLTGGAAFLFSNGKVFIGVCDAAGAAFMALVTIGGIGQYAVNETVFRLRRDGAGRQNPAPRSVSEQPDRSQDDG